MKVALDLDGVLAQTYDVAFDLMGVGDDFGYDDIESWSWGLDKFGDARFLSAMWHAWTLRSHEIQSMEDDISRLTTNLRTATDRLDVVTADPGHFGIKDAKREWLDEHNVYYDNLRISPMGGSKTQYNYDVYIDDNPHLPSEIKPGQSVLLYSAPYNQDIDGRYTRVDSLAEAEKEIRRIAREREEVAA